MLENVGCFWNSWGWLSSQHLQYRLYVWCGTRVAYRGRWIVTRAKEFENTLAWSPRLSWICTMALRCDFPKPRSKEGSRMPAFLISSPCWSGDHQSIWKYLEYSQWEGGSVAWVMTALGAQYTNTPVLYRSFLIEPFLSESLGTQGASITAAYSRVLITHMLTNKNVLEQKRRLREAINICSTPTAVSTARDLLRTTFPHAVLHVPSWNPFRLCIVFILVAEKPEHYGGPVFISFAVHPHHSDVIGTCFILEGAWKHLKGTNQDFFCDLPVLI